MPLHLAQVPQIIDLLQLEHAIDASQHATMLADLDAAKQTNSRVFAGQIGIERGFYDQATLDGILLEQTALKAEAAVKDIQTILAEGPQDAPAWLQANWGNHGVNQAAPNPSLADGVSAAANMAQNLVMLSNAYPELAPVAQQGIVAAANLARGVAGGASKRVPLNAENAGQWQAELRDSLQQSVDRLQAATGNQPVDRQGVPIDFNEFLTARESEIAAAVAQRLQHDAQQQRGPGGRGDR